MSDPKAPMKSPSNDDLQTLYTGRYLQMVKRGNWEYAVRPRDIEAVGIVAVTEDRHLVLVDQYRVPVDGRVIEIPAGLVNDDDAVVGEGLLETAQRELLEETGYQAAQWSEAMEVVSSAGLTDEACNMFVATQLTQVNEGGGLPDEDIVVVKMPIDGAISWLKQKRDEGYRIDAKVYAGLAMIATTTTTTTTTIATTATTCASKRSDEA